VVQVGGGLIVIATGWTLLKQRDDEKHDVHRTVQPQDTFHQAFYPLTMPLTVGPGSISVAITLGANVAHHHSYRPLTILAALIGLVLIAISILLCYDLPTGWRESWDNGMTVITQCRRFSCLHRCADCLERDQSIAGVGDATFWLTKLTFPLELPAATTGWPPARILPRVAILPSHGFLSRQTPVSGRTKISSRSNNLPEEWQRAYLSPRGPSAGVARRRQRIGSAWNVQKVGSAVASVGQQRKDGEEQNRLQCKRRAEMGPTRYKPDHNDHREDQVIDKPRGSQNRMAS